MSADRLGFSLIELLVVVAIIGILAAVGTVGYQGYIDNTKDQAAKANLSIMSRAIEQDNLANGTRIKTSGRFIRHVTNMRARTVGQLGAYMSKSPLMA